MYYVYVISSQIRKYIYIGLSNNVKRRFGEHQEGCNKTTSPYKPFSLIYVEEFKTRVEARVREKYFKLGIGREWIKNKLI